MVEEKCIFQGNCWRRELREQGMTRLPGFKLVCCVPGEVVILLRERRKVEGASFVGRTN